MALAREFTSRGGDREMRFGGAVLGAPVRVQEPKVRTFGLVLRPPLHQTGAFAPYPDNPVEVEDEHRVFAAIVGERRAGQRCQIGDVRACSCPGANAFDRRAPTAPRSFSFPGFGGWFASGDLRWGRFGWRIVEHGRGLIARRANRLT